MRPRNDLEKYFYSNAAMKLVDQAIVAISFIGVGDMLYFWGTCHREVFGRWDDLSRSLKVIANNLFYR